MRTMSSRPNGRDLSSLVLHRDDKIATLGEQTSPLRFNPLRRSASSPLRQGDNSKADTSVYPYDSRIQVYFSKQNRHGVEQQQVSVPIEEKEQKCLSVCAIRCRQCVKRVLLFPILERQTQATSKRRMSDVTQDGLPSAHFEHTVVVTKDGYQILTGDDNFE